MKLRLHVLLISSALLISGCASLDTNSYEYAQGREVAQTIFGTVLEARTVKISGQAGGLGAGIGSIIGGAAAGAGSGEWGYGILGGVIGALAGAGVEKMATGDSQGVEVTVRLDTGQVITVVQGGNEQFNKGERVKVITHNGVGTRVTHSGVSSSEIKK